MLAADDITGFFKSLYGKAKEVYDTVSPYIGNAVDFISTLYPQSAPIL